MYHYLKPNDLFNNIPQCLPHFPSCEGEWKARFDPRFTTRGVFYLDEQQMVEVEVMEDAKHPLSLFIDNELDAQVKTNSQISFNLFWGILNNRYFVPFYR